MELPFSPAIKVLLLSTLPLVELRGAIPLGIHLGLGPFASFVLGVAGSLVPVPFLLWLLVPVCSVLKRHRCFKQIIDYLYRRSAMQKNTLRRYGVLGLALFVAVPLPSTGAWSGSIIAALLGMGFWPSMAAIAIGALIAGFIVTLLTLFGYIIVS